MSRVRLVHISGGQWIREPPQFSQKIGALRLLDDHLHDIPTEVFTLLVTLASEVAQPLTVIIERDGEYPAFQSLLEQVETARSALIQGRILKKSRKELSIECAGH